MSAIPVQLLPITIAAARAVLAGRHLPHGDVRWHEEYPLTETYDALGMTARTHEALGSLGGSGSVGDTVPRWWMSQIVVDGIVVGDIGFHSPPADGRVGGATVVEIGYDVVPALRGQGIATAACGLILDQAWRDGATEVVAETDLDHAASQRVLTKAGFRATGPGTYAVSRPSTLQTSTPQTPNPQTPTPQTPSLQHVTGEAKSS